MNYQELINLQENKDRAIATAIFSKVKGILVIKDTEITCPVDLYCKLDNGKEFYTEIKELRGDYPHFLLKVGKYRRIRDYCKVGLGAYYMVLNNGKAYIFNLLTLDWTKVREIMLKLKKTLLDPNSKDVVLPTYLIPRELACNVLDINAFYKQTQEKAS